MAPNSVHVRVAAVLAPARGKRPTTSAWAIEAHDVGPDGAVTERLRASGAIATAATHPTHGRETVAKRHTWQVAMQVATGRALHYAEQLRQRGKRVTISIPNATTVRDLRPTRPDETRPRASHRDIASNNSRKLQQLGTQVTINVDTAHTPQRLGRRVTLGPRATGLGPRPMKRQLRIPAQKWLIGGSPWFL